MDFSSLWVITWGGLEIENYSRVYSTLGLFLKSEWTMRARDDAVELKKYHRFHLE